MKTLAEDMRDWALERDIYDRFDEFPELVARAERLEASAKHWQRVAEGLTDKLYELEALLARIPK